MSNDNMIVWDKLSRPPKEALKTIGGGRLKGMSDINPQWRYEIMTKTFGVCGVGWKFEISETWIEKDVSELQAVQMAKVLLFVFVDGIWCDPIPGVGGAMLVAKESGGLHTNDEALKMAVTDALGTAMKMLGVAADVYRGLWDGAKYNDAQSQAPQQAARPRITTPPGLQVIIDITQKSGTKKNGDTWTRYKIVDGNAKEFSTFDKKVAVLAKKAKQENAFVLIESEDDKYKTIKTLEIVDTGAQKSPMEPVDFPPADESEVGL